MSASLSCPLSDPRGPASSRRFHARRLPNPVVPEMKSGKKPLREEWKIQTLKVTKRIVENLSTVITKPLNEKEEKYRHTEPRSEKDAVAAEFELQRLIALILNLCVRGCRKSAFGTRESARVLLSLSLTPSKARLSERSRERDASVALVLCSVPSRLDVHGGLARRPRRGDDARPRAGVA